jgi:hypothetical protein
MVSKSNVKQTMWRVMEFSGAAGRCRPEYALAPDDASAAAASRPALHPAGLPDKLGGTGFGWWE